MYISRDKLWKSIIEDFREDFLRYFFPSLVRKIDFSRQPEFLDKDLAQLFPDHEEGDRRVDILMKVFLKDGTEQWFLIHTEIQGYDDASFARRMFTYYYRILDKYERDIITLVIFLNENTEFQPSEYRRTAYRTTLLFKYQAFSVTTHTMESLYKHNNPFSLVMQVALLGIRAKRVPAEQFDAWLFQQKTLLYRKLREDGYTAEKSRRFLSFLGLYLSFRSAANEIRFNTEVLQSSPIRNPMGIIELITEEAARIAKQEGEQIGLSKGKLEGWQEKTELFVLKLIQDTAFDDERIAELAGTTVEWVKEIRRRVSEEESR